MCVYTSPVWDALLALASSAWPSPPSLLGISPLSLTSCVGRLSHCQALLRKSPHVPTLQSIAVSLTEMCVLYSGVLPEACGGPAGAAQACLASLAASGHTCAAVSAALYDAVTGLKDALTAARPKVPCDAQAVPALF